MVEKGNVRITANMNAGICEHIDFAYLYEQLLGNCYCRSSHRLPGRLVVSPIHRPWPSSTIYPLLLLVLVMLQQESGCVRHCSTFD